MQEGSKFRVVDPHGRYVSLSEPGEQGIPVFSSGNTIPALADCTNKQQAYDIIAVAQKHYPQMSFTIRALDGDDQPLNAGPSSQTVTGLPDLKTGKVASDLESGHETLPKQTPNDTVAGDRAAGYVPVTDEAPETSEAGQAGDTVE